MHVCLAVTCHLHFWQNGRDILRATAVTRGWNGYRNESAQNVDPGEESSRGHDYTAILTTTTAAVPHAVTAVFIPPQNH